MVSALDYQDSGSVLSIDRIHFFTNQYGSGDTQPHKMSSKYLLEFLVFAWKEFGHCASLCCNIKNVLPWIYLYSKIFPKHCLFNKSFILILLMKIKADSMYLYCYILCNSFRTYNYIDYCIHFNWFIVVLKFAVLFNYLKNLFTKEIKT